MSTHTLEPVLNRQNVIITLLALILALVGFIAYETLSGERWCRVGRFTEELTSDCYDSKFECENSQYGGVECAKRPT